MMDFVGRFENLKQDISYVRTQLGISEGVLNHEKKNTKRAKHYSFFYTGSRKKAVEIKYKNDIQLLDYSYDEQKAGLNKLKLIL